jgi:hypothetical protein
MAQFLLLYTGGSGMATDPAEEERIMAQWGAWYGKMGEAVTDGGAPFGAAKSLTGSGLTDGPLGDNPATGYTVIEADSLDAAAAATEGHPHVSHGGQVQVFECIDMGGAG